MCDLLELESKTCGPICGQNSQHSTVRRWQDGEETAKPLIFFGGWNFERQMLNELPGV